MQMEGRRLHRPPSHPGLGNYKGGRFLLLPSVRMPKRVVGGHVRLLEVGQKTLLEELLVHLERDRDHEREKRDYQTRPPLLLRLLSPVLSRSPRVREVAIGSSVVGHPEVLRKRTFR